MDITLFVLFGRGADGKLNPSLLTIDVGNASNILYTAIYASNTTSNSSDSNSKDSNSKDSNSDDSDSKESSGLSKGAVGGIAGGSVVAVSTIKLLEYFWLI